MKVRARVGLGVSVAFVAAAVVAPAASAESPSNGYCENVRFSITQDMPQEANQAVVQSFYLDAQCRVVVSPAKQVTAGSLSGSEVAGSTASQSLGTTGEQAIFAAAAASINRVGYASTRVYDCCGIMLTEHWLELRWTTSTVVTAWSATHGAKWHREAGGVTGWSLDAGNSSIGRVSGGSSQKWIKVKGRQGFKYQGAFDPTGTLFYNDLTDTVQGATNGGQTCTHSYNLRRVPAGPLAWPTPTVSCVKAAYPNP